MTHNIQHRANAAMADIDAARTPAQKHAARQEGLAVKADLEKQLSDNQALAAFKAAQPHNSFLRLQGQHSPDAPGFMTGPAETRASHARSNFLTARWQRQIRKGKLCATARFAAEMTRRYFRANSVITALAKIPDV